MINLTPIAKTIQERLFEIMKVLGRQKTPPGDPTSKANEHLLEMKDIATRTTFIRMISGQERPVVMMGGELSEDNEMMTGFKDIYGPKTYGKTDTGPLGEKIKLSSKNQYYYKEQGSGEGVVVDNPNITTKHPNVFKRPMPGIKSIDVQFKGGVRALRQASISWTCWTFDDLDRLRTHFLSHGKAVALEWGWVYDKNEFIKVMSDHSLINEDGTLKEGAFSDHRNRIFKAKGDFDFMVGIVKNFDYTTRDDGGFDCKTDIISTGVNLFDMDSSQGASSDRMKLFNISERDDINTKIRKLQEFKNDPTKLANVYYDNNISFSIFLEQLDHYIDKEFNFAAKLQAGDQDYLVEPNILIARKRSAIEIQQSKYIGEPTTGIFGFFKDDYPEYTRNESSIVNTHDIWVRWGWFEDNILSKFVTFLTIPPGPGATVDSTIINEFRSIEPILDAATGKPTGKFESTKIRNHKFLQTTNYNKFILPGQFNPLSTKFLEDASREEGMDPRAPHPSGVVHAPMGLSQITIDGDTPGVQSLGTISQTEENFPPFAVPETDRRYGYLRNILFNVQFLQQQFSYIDRTTIHTGFDNLFNAMNEDINFWDLQLTNDEHEPKRTKIIDNNTTVYNWEANFNPLETKTKLNETDGKINTLGVFHFPVWQHNSLVKSQNLTAKLPNAMQIAAMYGANADAYSTILGSDENMPKEGTRIGALGKDGKDRYMNGAELALRVNGVVLGTEFGDENESLLPQDPTKTNFPGGSFDAGGVTNIINSLKEDITSEIGKLIQAKKYAAKAKAEQLSGEIHSVYVGRLLSPETLGHKGFWRYLHQIASNPEISADDKNSIFHTFAYMYNPEGDLKKPFIREMDFMITKQGNKKSSDLPVLIPLELELTINGIGGIYPGNSFHSGYVPKRYVDETIFQAFNVNHTVDSTGWSVSLTGKMRCTLSGLYENVFKEDEKIAQLWDELTKTDTQQASELFNQGNNTKIDAKDGNTVVKPKTPLSSNKPSGGKLDLSTMKIIPLAQEKQ